MSEGGDFLIDHLYDMANDLPDEDLSRRVKSVLLARHPNGKLRRLVVSLHPDGPTAEDEISPEL
jgi:hypothetical protein